MRTDSSRAIKRKGVRIDKLTIVDINVEDLKEMQAVVFRTV